MLFVACTNDELDTDLNHAILEEGKLYQKASMEEIEGGIKAYIDSVSQADNGVFIFKNDTLELKMRLVRVHTEYLSNVGPEKYFACVDLADENGDVFDVDFFLEGPPGEMRVTETSLHKLNGKPYYAWKQNKQNKMWYKVAQVGLEHALLGVVEDTDFFEFYYQITLPEIQGKAQLWIPIAQTDDFQKVEILSTQFPVKAQVLLDSTHGNKAFFLELNDRNAAQKVEILYRVNRLEKKPYSPNKSETIGKYLLGNTLIPVNDDFRKIAHDAIGLKTTHEQLIQARALYDHVIDNLKYIKDGNHGTGDAVYACDAQSGNCSEFHSYFIALARSVGIPARFAIGAAIPSDRDEGGIDGYHCWAEFFAEGKWWPVDISEANKYTALATYYFGHHPANRIEFSRGRDISFSPEPQSGPINFFAFPIMEINGYPVKPKVEFRFSRLMPDSLDL
jgi:transglutaminase-like putative cysteine protease